MLPAASAFSRSPASSHLRTSFTLLRHVRSDRGTPRCRELQHRYCFLEIVFGRPPLCRLGSVAHAEPGFMFKPAPCLCALCRSGSEFTWEAGRKNIAQRPGSRGFHNFDGYLRNNRPRRRTPTPLADRRVETGETVIWLWRPPFKLRVNSQLGSPQFPIRA